MDSDPSLGHHSKLTPSQSRIADPPTCITAHKYKRCCADIILILAVTSGRCVSSPMTPKERVRASDLGSRAVCDFVVMSHRISELAGLHHFQIVCRRTSVSGGNYSRDCRRHYQNVPGMDLLLFLQILEVIELQGENTATDVGRVPLWGEAAICKAARGELTKQVKMITPLLKSMVHEEAGFDRTRLHLEHDRGCNSFSL
eukprot:4626356-Amphidinium_carterae.5